MLKLVTKSKSVVATAERAKRLDQQIKQLESELKDCKTVLQKHLGEKEALIFANRELVTWKHHSKDVFNQKRFSAEHAELFAQYLETVDYRRFLIK